MISFFLLSSSLQVSKLLSGLNKAERAALLQSLAK